MSEKNRLVLTLALVFYISIGHIFLPIFNKSEFFFLYQWRLFSVNPGEFIYDLTWEGDEGTIFFLRDYKDKIYQIGNPHTVQDLLQDGKINLLRKDYKKKILNFCQCDTIMVVKLKGSFSDYMIFNKSLEVLEQIEL